MKETTKLKFFLILVLLFCLHGFSFPEKKTSLSEGVVVSYDKRASQVGIDIMKQGGNAVDATVAVGFALAVVHPAAGNIGGGGFMLIWLKNGPISSFVDYRETAPAGATKEMFLDEKGEIDRDKAHCGYLAAGVPGTVAGLYLAHQEFGSLPWSKLIEPSIKLAEEGFIVDKNLADSLEQRKKIFEKYPSSKKLFFKNGQPYKEGERLIQRDLANTLKLVADKGKDGFYTGPVAQLIAQDMANNGGLITENDLATYQAIVRKPLSGSYRNFHVLVPPPPSSGGVTLIQMLNILEGFDFSQLKPLSPWTIHLMTETMKLAYYDRARYLGDMDFVTINLQELTSKRYASRLRERINKDKAFPSIDLGKVLITSKEGEATTHYSVVDPQGNAVSNTYTINSWFGSHAAAEGTGFLLNDEMADFNLKPGLTDDKGNIGTWPNRIEPGKRMLSSMTPAILLKDGKPFLVTGSPGGRRIITTVLEVIINLIDFKMPAEKAVKFPRFHHQWLPDIIGFEKDAVSQEVLDNLRKMGHQVIIRDYQQGNAHTIYIDPKTGKYQGIVDIRRE
jgi:gamma-glutamyltranspeptidase/glutathione hydrolase